MNLNDVQAGDQVGYYSRYGRKAGIKGPFTVERTTKTRVILADGRVFKRDGYPCGGNHWSRSWMQPWTPELAAQQAELEAKRTAENLCFAMSERLRKARNDVDAWRSANPLIVRAWADELKAEARDEP